MVLPETCGGLLRRSLCSGKSMLHISLRRLGLVTVLAGAFAAQAGPSARASTEPAAAPVLVPSAQELARVSLAGNYLAARMAVTERDQRLAAAYLRAALRVDPGNRELLERTFNAVLSAGNVEEAARFAERIVQLDRNHRIARLVLGVRAIKLRQFQVARQNMGQAARGPVGDLTGGILSAWTLFGAGDTDDAIARLDQLTGPEWFSVFRELHAGLILDAAGRRRDAVRRLEKAYQLDQTALRIVEAYGRALSRAGERDKAMEVFQAFDKVLPRHPLITDAMEDLTAGRTLDPMVRNSAGGSAEFLYGLGSWMSRQGGEELGLVYLQLALFLDNDNPLALLSLADLYEQIKQPHNAIEAYERVPDASPLKRNAEIQLGLNLDSIDRTAEARRHLEALIAQRPDDTDAIMALGNVLRGRKVFSECGAIYSRAIDQVKQPTRANWTMFYFRGICHERNKQWALAEPDFKKALELYPDQPHVLNYLGYSWIDQGVNIEDGTRMIRRAVEQRPDDGYIVDSLGWAYYRVGNYEEAVKHLERAVELKPEDPVINDHLGDAYWKVGRKLEARFQWTHARDLKPEPEDLARIEDKLKNGMPEAKPATVGEEAKPKPGGG
jgi:tetratricopeptide (TPR) repeat protein